MMYVSMVTWGGGGQLNGWQFSSIALWVYPSHLGFIELQKVKAQILLKIVVLRVEKHEGHY